MHAADSCYDRRCYVFVLLQEANPSLKAFAATNCTVEVQVTVESLYQEVLLSWRTMELKRKLNVGEGDVKLSLLVGMPLRDLLDL